MKTKDLIIGIVAVAVLLAGYFLIAEKGPAPAKIAPKTGQNQEQSDFKGEKGAKVEIVNGEIMLDESSFQGTKANFYNAQLPNKTVFFFVVKDKEGVFRAAANACQVCYSARIGFRQEGDFMVCNNCNNAYPVAKIATEKGGCNPGPINPNLEVRDGKVIINQEDLEKVADLF